MAQTRNPMSAEALEAFIQDEIEANNVPGLSVTVVKGDRVAWEWEFGFADLAASTPAAQRLPCNCGWQKITHLGDTSLSPGGIG